MPVYSSPDDAPSSLQTLLLTAVPANAHGNKTILGLAAALGVSRWAVQKWIISNKIPANRAMQVVDISEGRVSLNDFTRFVYGLSAAMLEEPEAKPALKR